MRKLRLHDLDDRDGDRFYSGTCELGKARDRAKRELDLIPLAQSCFPIEASVFPLQAILHNKNGLLLLDTGSAHQAHTLALLLDCLRVLAGHLLLYCLRLLLLK